MKEITITASKVVEGEKREVSISYNVGETVEEAVSMFGEKAVLDCFVAALKIQAQSAMRRGLENGLPNDEIVSMMSSWRPGQRLVRGYDPLTELKKRLPNLSEEDKKLLKQLAKQL